mgnify:FL=1
MERKEIVRCFFKKVVLPVALAAFLFFLFRPVCTEENGAVNYVLLWILCGIPFGIRRMFVWLVPHGYDIGGTVGIMGGQLHCRRSDRRRDPAMAVSLCRVLSFQIRI